MPTSMSGSDPIQPMDSDVRVRVRQFAYQLLGTRGGMGFTTQNGTGTPQATNADGSSGPVLGANYIYRIMGTFAGHTASLQVLDADGVSWLTVQTDTAPGTHQVTIGASPDGGPPNVRVQLSGGTGAPNVWANLS